MSKPIARIEVPVGLSNHTPSKPVIGVCKDMSSEALINVAVDYRIWQLVQSSLKFFDDEVKTSEIMISDLNTYMTYPISSILTPTAAGEKNENKLLIFSEVFSKVSDKASLLMKMENLLTDGKRPKSHVHEVMLVADEMITNALYNAPHVTFLENGPGADRTWENGNTLSLTPARLFMGIDGSRLVLGCADGYGTLNPDLLLQKLQRCFALGPRAAMKWNSGGAGLGIFMMFRSILAYYAGIEKNRRTVVSCTFPANGRRNDKTQSIHLSTDFGF